MAKDFDTDPTTRRGSRLALDREFTLGGETFRVRTALKVGSTALDRWRGVLGRMTAQARFENAEAEEGATPAPLPADHREVEDDEFMETFRETMGAILEPGQEVALDRVISSETAPLMVSDAFEVCFWAVGVVTGRPTDASRLSSSGSTTPTTEPVSPSLTAGSSSPAEPESGA
jgi:hypothetical protein